MRRFSNSHAYEAYLPEDEKQEQEAHSRRTMGGGKENTPNEKVAATSRDGKTGRNRTSTTYEHMRK